MWGRGVGEGGSFLPSGAAAGCVRCVLGFDGLRHGLACWMCGSVRLPCSLQAAPWDPPRISGDMSLAGADVRWPGQPLRTGGSCAPAPSHQRLFTVSMSTLEGGHAGCKCPPARHEAGVGAGAGTVRESVLTAGPCGRRVLGQLRRPPLRAPIPLYVTLVTPGLQGWGAVRAGGSRTRSPGWARQDLGAGRLSLVVQSRANVGPLGRASRPGTRHRPPRSPPRPGFPGSWEPGWVTRPCCALTVRPGPPRLRLGRSAGPGKPAGVWGCWGPDAAPPRSLLGTRTSPWPRRRLGPQASGPAPSDVLRRATSTLPPSEGRRGPAAPRGDWAPSPRLRRPRGLGEARVRGKSCDTFSRTSLASTSKGSSVQPGAQRGAPNPGLRPAVRLERRGPSAPRLSPLAGVGLEARRRDGSGVKPVGVKPVVCAAPHPPPPAQTLPGAPGDALPPHSRR